MIQLKNHLQMDQFQFVDAIKKTKDFDPDETWEDAHFPLPEGMGDETIKLHHFDHQIQGIFQSEEVGRRCFWMGDAVRALNAPGFFPPGWFEAWDLFDKWKMKDGFFDADPESRQEWRKRGGQVAGRQAAERRTGIFDPKVQGANGTKSQEKHRKNGTGFFDREVKRMGAKVTNSQKWECLVTGKISTAGPLSRFQKKRGIDTSLRRKVSGD